MSGRGGSFGNTSFAILDVVRADAGYDPITFRRKTWPVICQPYLDLSQSLLGFEFLCQAFDSFALFVDRAIRFFVPGSV